jgi:chaperonin cofactor prefoldin
MATPEPVNPTRPPTRPATRPPARTAGPQDIDTLRKRYEILNTERTVAETDLKHAQTRLQELQAMAREQYGTDDLDALRQKLAQIREENERRRAAYQASLDGIQASLQAVESQYQQALHAGEADQ